MLRGNKGGGAENETRSDGFWAYSKKGILHASGALPLVLHNALMKVHLVWLGVVAGALIWVVELRRRLRAAMMRGDMYRDISARLDRRLAELTAQNPPAQQ